MTHPEVAGQLQGTPQTEQWVVPQWLGWSSHSLAYEFTQLAKPSQTTFQGPSSCPLQWPTPCRVCFSLNPNTSTSYLLLCLSLKFLQWDIKAWASLGPEARHPGFWLGSSPRRAEGQLYYALGDNIIPILLIRKLKFRYITRNKFTNHTSRKNGTKIPIKISAFHIF